MQLADVNFTRRSANVNFTTQWADVSFITQWAGVNLGGGLTSISHGRLMLTSLCNGLTSTSLRSRLTSFSLGSGLTSTSPGRLTSTSLCSGLTSSSLCRQLQYVVGRNVPHPSSPSTARRVNNTRNQSNPCPIWKRKSAIFFSLTVKSKIMTRSASGIFSPNSCTSPLPPPPPEICPRPWGEGGLVSQAVRVLSTLRQYTAS